MRLILRVGAWSVADVELLDPFQVVTHLRAKRKTADRPPTGFAQPQPRPVSETTE